MNQATRIVRAINQITPVLSSVRQRRPAGFHPVEADKCAERLSSAHRDLNAALEFYRQAEQRRES